MSNSTSTGPTKRELFLLRRAFGPVAKFDGPYRCPGMSRNSKNKTTPCLVAGHGRGCRGGKVYWWVKIPIWEPTPMGRILGSGNTPGSALGCAVRRKSQRGARNTESYRREMLHAKRRKISDE